MLDAVIIVLAVTLLLERALGRRTMNVLGWRVTVRLPTGPMAALWTFFAGSVAGNVGHASQILAAQLVAAVPPVSAALTFHLLLRLLDRAPVLRAIAETYDERGVDEKERAAARKARRARIKTGRHSSSGAVAPTDARVSGNGHPDPTVASDRQHPMGPTNALPPNRQPPRPSRHRAGRRAQPATTSSARESRLRSGPANR